MNAKPFLKWAGGKTQLIPEIQKVLPQGLFSRKTIYVEPFVGGGSVLFWILQNHPNITHAVINDINPKLITTYNTVRDFPDDLLSELYILQNEYSSLDSELRKTYFLKKRDEFNNAVINDIQSSALFIFLNRTCFNGLFRVNSKGLFNVPHGRYSNPKICDEALIRLDSQLLQKVEIINGDFEQTIRYVADNAFFYFDPPYKPISKTASFNSYAKESFGDDEQIRLCEFCKKISNNECKFILSNSDVKDNDSNNNFFDDIYGSFNIYRVSASRIIGANKESRNKLNELLITNF